ncbi:ParB N-terminal domain-containing protein [Microbacterium resistens]|uniref:ParB N-terminal domain-containing protein n=1 Tax=Microbacterium resistens TaxID=156977 RepID=A0ABY3RSS8_9MICO|nr:ParB N-terminal domain-containing protein [Microbacterium resistens]UGS26350.1 ParB N-terminal domain-containing protein [Microbacterium resistens]
MILRTVDVPTTELRPYRGNPRRGNVDLIVASLQAHGQYRPLVVNEGTKTGVPMEVLAGNHTLQAAQKLGWDTVLVSIVDVDEKQAAKIVAVDNRANDVAEYDEDALLALLQGLDGDLDGTGYDLDDLDDLVKDDEGAPGAADFLEPEDDKYQSQYGVTVICADEGEQEAVYERLRADGYECRVVTV